MRGGEEEGRGRWEGNDKEDSMKIRDTNRHPEVYRDHLPKETQTCCTNSCELNQSQSMIDYHAVYHSVPNVPSLCTYSHSPPHTHTRMC